ncbi:CU044_5270 family protein [Nonomuraea guangzhouensis]|uniref:CU044_5270 family protein n=1 Tax=Nonomuraea guangzhouensis TaxID=1291555 RepID=A0ABW4GDN8_9ACTN|nr:CU044_5270 family protein [Nonomuraea guangzhouensis]
MDDLDSTLATLLAKPEPSTEAINGSRDRLNKRMRGRRRVGWLVPGLGLATAAAAAAVAVIATGVTAPAAAPASAREVLLMAAVSAERTPEGSGDYWHVTRKWSDPEMPQEESWTSRDGRRWSKGEPGDPPDAVVTDPAPLALKGVKVTLEDLDRLPTDPEALKARIDELPGDDSGLRASEARNLSLFALITELPAPSEVRSAAFRALATLPEVKRTGTVDNGEELLIADPDGKLEIKLVIDPDNARVMRTNYLVADDGSLAGGPVGFISVTTGWTDQPPQ